MDITRATAAGYIQTSDHFTFVARWRRFASELGLKLWKVDIDDIDFISANFNSQKSVIVSIKILALKKPEQYSLVG